MTPENPLSQPDREPIETIHLYVNGEPETCEAGLALPAFLQHLGLNPRLVAVEYNGDILHHQYWATTEVRSGDRLEIVTIVGGG